MAYNSHVPCMPRGIQMVVLAVNVCSVACVSANLIVHADVCTSLLATSHVLYSALVQTVDTVERKSTYS